LFDHIKTNEISKNIRVGNTGIETDGWRMVRIAERQFDLKMKNTTLVESALRSSEICMPYKHIGV
jgi:hypothetical protein